MIEILVNYVNGARGAFLANIMTNQFDVIRTGGYEVMPRYDLVSAMHNLAFQHNTPHGTLFKSYDEMFDVCEKMDIKTFRIVSNTIEERLNITHFDIQKNAIIGKRGESLETKLKNKNRTLDDFSKNYKEVISLWMPHTINFDLEDYNYLHRYDYIVEFKDLFDVDKINELYKSKYNTDLTKEQREILQNNIDLQDLIA